MREDPELIFKLLLELEDKEKVDLKKYDDAIVDYHKSLIKKERLAEGKDYPNEDGTKDTVLFNLTSKGYNYLDNYKLKNN